MLFLQIIEDGEESVDYVVSKNYILKADWCFKKSV